MGGSGQRSAVSNQPGVDIGVFGVVSLRFEGRVRRIDVVGSAMVKQPRIFDDEWLQSARTSSPNTSWAREVIETLDTAGQIYLSTLRLWFDKYPLTPKQKRTFRIRLESLHDDQHLGAVNELAWWAFMLYEGLIAIPLSCSKESHPDFQLQPPTDCFVEVSTLIVSQKDKENFEAKKSVPLDHAETIRRVVGKLTDEKQRQLKYAADRVKPCVLAIFDYTTWSGIGTLFFKILGEFLLGIQYGFKSFPLELSAIVYLERKVFNGRIALSRERSAVYYNPLAMHPLPVGTFSSLNQFRSQFVSTEPRSNVHWLWL